MWLWCDFKYLDSVVEPEVDHVECPVPAHGGRDALGEQSPSRPAHEPVLPHDLPHDRGRGRGHGLVRAVRLHLDLDHLERVHQHSLGHAGTKTGQGKRLEVFQNHFKSINDETKGDCPYKCLRLRLWELECRLELLESEELKEMIDEVI